MDEIRTEVEKPGAPLLMVGFNRRFAPLAVKMKAFLDQSAEPFAAHYRVNAGFIPPEHWVHDPAQGGGRILGEGCHFIDFLTWLAGAPPVEVSAKALPDMGRYRGDNAVITLTFPDGSVGTLSYLANGDKSVSKEWVEVFAGGRVAVLDDFPQPDPDRPRPHPDAQGLPAPGQRPRRRVGRLCQSHSGRRPAPHSLRAVVRRDGGNDEGSRGNSRIVFIYRGEVTSILSY